MDNQNEQDEQKEVREVTAPLEITQIKEYFTNKNIFFQINCLKSSLEGDALITYISNLDLPCELNLAGLDLEKKNAILKSYFSTKSLCSSQKLRSLASRVLLEKVGVDSDFLGRDADYNKDDIKKFISENETLVKQWVTVVSSTMIYLLTVVEAIEEEYDFSKNYDKDPKEDEIGYNFVHLFSEPMFTEAFFSVPAQSEIYFYPKLYKEYIYKGNNFYQYYAVPENLLLITYEALLSGQASIEDLEALAAYKPGPTEKA